MGYLLKDRLCSVTVGALQDGTRKGLKVDGLRVNFRIEKSLKPEPNKCECSIYNLSKKHRAQIEEMRPKKGDARGIPLLIEAGHKSTGAGQVWLGDLRTVSSSHDGADWITKIETGDGEAAKSSSVHVSYGPGTSPDIALRAIVKALGIDEGNAAAAAVKLRQAGGAALFPRRLVLSGSAATQLDRFCNSAGLEWSIQDSAVQILDRGKTLSSRAVVLKGKLILESPSVDPKGVLSFKTFIQPDLKCGSLLVIDAPTASGNYRVTKTALDGDTHAQPWYISGEATRY